METGRAALVVALAFLMLATSTAAAVETPPAASLADLTGDTIPTPDDPSGRPLQAPRLGGDPAAVVVVTNDMSELTREVARLTGHPLRTPRAPEFGTPVLTLPRNVVEELRRLPSTVEVIDYVPPTKHMPDDPEARSFTPPAAMNWNSTINHKAPMAWARGVTGDGVRVAIVDDGLDFGHPDLLGTMARVQDPGSPFYGWPMAFDPNSMGTYLRQGNPRGTWYADTSSTDRNVTHTLRVDGKNDFWTDGSELVATDSSSDIGVPDFDLVTLYATQNATFWYFGFSTRANHTSMAFTLYINTTTGAGAPTDPLGNYVVPDAAHRPEYAVYMVHNGLMPPGQYDLNDTMPQALAYRWSGTAWDPPADITDGSVGGLFAYSGYDFLVGEGFVEVGIPKAYLGDPAAISVQLFTTGTNRSHAQDTVYSDPNVAFAMPDWSSTPTGLSAMTIVGRGFWRHTYVRPDDLVGGQPNVQFTWPVEYVVTGTSRSGAYLFGDHPDENYPLTRVLVADEAVAGVYDTVYVDLDHNKDFRNDKPLRRYGKYDANGNWHPPSWPGVGTVYDETAWADFYDPAGGVVSVAWSPSGSWLATGGRDHQVLIWDTTSWTVDRTLNGRHGRVTSVVFNPTGTYLAVGHDDVGGRTQYSIDIWQVPAWTLFRTITIHSGAVREIAWNPAGTRFVSVSEGGTARIYDTVTQLVTDLVPGHTGSVTGAAWSALNTIATVGADGRVKLWNSAGAPLLTHTYGSALNDVAFHPGGTFVALAGQDGNVTMLEVATGNRVSASGAHFGNPVLHIAFNGTGDRLVSSSEASVRFDPTLATWSVTSWDTFVMLDRRFGAHIDADRGYAIPAAEYSPTGAFIASGGMDALAKTWTPVLIADQVLRGHTIGSTDSSRYTAGDGIADASGGIVYFIAQNATFLPYSARFIQNSGDPTLVNLAPANGTLVAFMGALDLASSHGTLMASSIVGRGVTRYFDATALTVPSPPQVYGIAPGAKLIAVANAYQTSFFDAWRFAVEGYDGQPGTGDEAQIVANSFGFSGTYEDSWDFYSRFADWVSTQYAQGKTIFTVSAGNDGNGYGTVTSPGAAAGVVTAGAATDFFYRLWAGLEKGPSQSYGDVVPFSSRGPTALGKPDPDVLAVGRMSVGATPLNMKVPANGAVASELWSGTSLSSPLAAGILALVYQAYRGAHGGFPDAEVAKAILMSGADDLNYDAFSQGAGFANADRATKLAGNLDGVRVAPSVWTPGTYRGQAYPAFVSLMAPGSSAGQTFTVRNENRTTGATVVLSDSVFRRTATVTYPFATPVDASNAPVDEWHALLAASPAADLYGGAGVYRVTPTGLSLVTAVDEAQWIDADLVRITIAGPQTAFDPTGDGANDYRYMLDVYDYTETDWTSAIPDTATFTDLNRVSINHPEANVFSATVHNAPIRTHDGLVFGTRLFGTGLGGLPMRSTIEFFQRVDWNWVTLSAPQISPLANQSTTFGATVAVPAGTPIGTYQGSITLRSLESARDAYTVSASGGNWIRLTHFDTVPGAVWVNGIPVPAADLTFYAAAGLIRIATPLSQGDTVEVQYDHYDHTTVPVAVSVGATGPEVSFGGTAPGQDDLYGSFVGPGFGNGGQSGDFRFYYTDVADEGLFQQGRGLKFLVDASWDLSRTDVDAFAFGTGGSAPMDVSAFDSARYGPYLVGRNNGGSEVTSNFFTTTGGAREIVAPRVTGGLNILALHAVRMNGTAREEAVSGSTALMTVSPESLRIVTNRLAGDRGVNVHSTVGWPGLGAVSAGPSAPQRFVNLHIEQDSTEGPTFVEILAKGSFVYPVRVQRSALIFDVRITSDPGSTLRPNPDLDLGVFLDGKGAGNAPDGRAQASEFVAMNADADANEQVRLIKPVVEDDPDTPGVDESAVGSPYLVVVLGFTVPWAPYGTFNMDLTLVQGEGFQVSGTSATPIPAYARSTLGLSWNLPGSTQDGSLLGALYLGPSIAPLTLLIPIELVIDRAPPTFQNFTLSAPSGSVVADDGRTVNSPRPTVVASFEDAARGELDAGAVRLWVDGEDATSRADVTVPWSANAQLINGLWSGTLTYEAPDNLEEGPHAMEVVIGDFAGNTATLSRTVVVDSLAPALVIQGPPLRFTRQATETVAGSTEPGASLTIGTQSVPVAPDGSFSAALALSPGRNNIEVRSADWFHQDVAGPIPGNEAKIALAVVYDTEAPLLTLFPPASPTSSDVAILRGRVTESISPTEAYDPATVVVRVEGRRAWVGADGTFEIALALAEGANDISVDAVDLAGNPAMGSVTVVRDTAAPLLEVSDIPVTTTAGVVNVSGRTEPTALVLVNGFVARTAPDGTFYREVFLSAGSNPIVLQVRDVAGNVIERRYVVSYVSPPSGTGALWAWAGAAVGLALLAALALAFLIGRGYLAWPPWGAPRPEAPAEEPPAAEEGRPAPERRPEGAPPPEGVRPEEVPAGPTVDDRVSRIEAAFAAGRISREAYERNLRALGHEPVPEAALVPVPPPTPAPPTREERVARLKAAYESGKLSPQAYADNLAKLGFPAPEPPAPAAPAPEDRRARLEAAFRAGKLSEDAYRANLARLGLAPEPPVPPVPATPSVDERLARLERAYREGRMSKAAYEANLAMRAAPPPPPDADRIAMLRSALDREAISREMYARNLVKILGLEGDSRAASLSAAFTAGRIPANLFDSNLRRLARTGP